jgi:hypothetical protein
MIGAYGNYPDKEQKIRVATLLSEALALPQSIFYDSAIHHGYLERGLENARRKLPGEYCLVNALDKISCNRYQQYLLIIIYSCL